MASAREIEPRDDQVIIALDGVQNASTLWDIQLDAATDHPYIYLRDNYVPVGSRHPDFDFLVATRYEQVEKYYNTKYIYRVWYTNPIVLLDAEWTVSVDSGLVDETVFYSTDINTGDLVPIGPHAYTTEIPTGQTAPFEITEPGTGKTIGLRRVSNDNKHRLIEGITVPRAHAELAFETTISIVRPGADLVAESYLNSVNAAQWYGRSARTVLFTRMQVAQTPGVIIDSSQPATGKVFNVRLTFAVKPKSNPQEFWTPRSIMEYYETGGFKVPVRVSATGNIVTSDYGVAGESDFSSLLAVFNPKTPAGILKPGTRR